MHDVVRLSMVNGFRAAAGIIVPSSPSTSRWLVITAALAFLAVSASFTTQQIHYDRSQSLASAVRQNQNRVDGFYKYVLRTLELANAQLSSAAQSPVVDRALGDRSPSNPMALPFAGVTKRFVAVTIQKPAAQGRAHSAWPFVSASQPLVGETAEKLSVIGPFRGPGGHRFLGLTKRFSRPRGPDYSLTLWVEPSVFTDFAESISFNQTDLISMIGLDGITRVRRTGNVTSYGEDLRGTLVMERQNLAPNGTYYGPSSIDGLPRIFSHRRIPGHALFVTSGVSMSNALSQHYHHRKTYLIYLAAEAVFLLLATYFLLRGISHRQLQISALRVAADRLNEAQKVGKVGSWDYDFATGQLVWSHNLSAMYQRPPDRPVTGLDAIAEFVGAADREKIRDSIERVRNAGETLEFELTVTLPDGTRSVRKIVAVATYDSSGAISGVHGTDQDISDLKEVELLETKLANLAQIDAMNAIASTLAHELNQPLSAMANYSSAAAHLLAQEESQVPAARDLIGKSIHQVHLCADIINSARDLVRREKAEVNSASLVRILNDCLIVLTGGEDFEPRWVTLSLDPTADRVLARPAQITQVLLNLIRNSLEAIPAARTPKIVLSSSASGASYCTVEVRDNGTGFADSPFSVLASSKSGGLGIGLSLCRTIIEAHGGRIWVASSGECGSSIKFTLRQAPSEFVAN